MIPYSVIIANNLADSDSEDSHCSDTKKNTKKSLLSPSVISTMKETF